MSSLLDALQNAPHRELVHAREATRLTQPEAPSTARYQRAATSNKLRPSSFDDIVGQDKVKRLLIRVMDAVVDKGEPLPHVLFVGASGTGKSTFSHVIANEMGVEVFEVEAPVSLDTLLDLREVMRDHDLLRIEEIHLQALQERRGRAAATEPEVWYSLMEDRTITTSMGVLDYPNVTIIGTTTDPGMLPDAFLNRFPLQPRLEPYSESELQAIVLLNAGQLGVGITKPAAARLARASRGVPRHINNYITAARLLAPTSNITVPVAREVIHDLNDTSEDGLTRDMREMLTFLYTRTRRMNVKGDVVYQASVNTIATALGLSRDTKAVALRVEPELIRRGYVQVGHGGRLLTDEGVARAKQLCTRRP